MTIIDHRSYEWVGIKRTAYLRTHRPYDLQKVYVKCMDCDKRATCWDHRDYLKPDDIDPVCHSCNWKRGPAKPVNVDDLSPRRRENFYKRQFELKVLRLLNQGNNQTQTAKKLGINKTIVRKLVDKFRKEGRM